MRFETGPVCIVDQTAPKTTPRPTPRDASRINEVRTQLAPADDARFAGAARAARRGDGVQCDRWDVVSSFFGSGFWVRSVCGRRGAAN